MRHGIVAAIIAVLLLSARAFAADGGVAALRKELRQLRAQISAAERKARRTDAIKELVKAERKARKAYEKAIAEIPEVKQLDEKIAELRKQMAELYKKRRDLLKQNAEALADPLQAMKDAAAAVKQALMELPGLRELYEKQKELRGKLKTLGDGRKRRPGAGRKPHRQKHKAGKKPAPPEAGGGCGF